MSDDKFVDDSLKHENLEQASMIEDEMLQSDPLQAESEISPVGEGLLDVMQSKRNVILSPKQEEERKGISKSIEVVWYWLAIFFIVIIVTLCIFM